jgi:uncharacterized protein (DUF885 family)
MKGLPTFRTVVPFLIYTGEWALCAEHLAFEKDPYNYLVRLLAELLRAVQLAANIDIHYQRQTREQAIGYMGYMRRTTGVAPSDVTAEIERYIVMPGPTCAYKVGMLTFLKLRERAKLNLGRRSTCATFTAWC